MKMEKIMNFFKNKAVGYFIVAADALIAIILTIVFFVTYKGAMAFSAVAPEILGIFLLAGAIVELVVLVLPQYRFIHIAAIAMFSLALFKETLLIPNLIADYVNNVFYQGGNLGVNVFYLVTILLILGSAIAAAFIGFYKKEEEANADMPIEKNNVGQIVKVGVGGVVVLAAVLTSSLVAWNMQKNANVFVPVEGFNPITEEVKAKAEAANYTFKPEEVVKKEQESYDFTGDVKNVTTNTTRDGHNMVYYFEGSYSEGWQGDYSATYGYICLWDDGLYGGKIGDIKIKGYWFNSSSAAAEGVKDCLKMVSDHTLNDKITINNQKTDNYKHDSLIAQKGEGFYKYQVYAYLNFSWGERSMILGGYEYYPEVAIAINTQNAELTAYKGEEYDMSSWLPTRILSSLDYSSIFKPVDVAWAAQDGKVTIAYVDNDKNRGISSVTAVFDSVGEKDVTIKWNGFEASVKVNVVELEEEAE